MLFGEWVEAGQEWKDEELGDLYRVQERMMVVLPRQVAVGRKSRYYGIGDIWAVTTIVLADELDLKEGERKRGTKYFSKVSVWKTWRNSLGWRSISKSSVRLNQNSYQSLKRRS